MSQLPHIKKVIETALLVSRDALSVRELKRLFEQELSSRDVQAILLEIQADWQHRGVELLQLSSGWRFRARVEMQPYLARLQPRKQPRYARAVMETLAIIAYRQPVTRADIEAIRGVAVSSQVMQTLEERQWIEAVGHKEVPGRPRLFGTTRQFLDDLGLKSLRDLPPLRSLDDLDLPAEIAAVLAAPPADEA